MLNGQLDKLQFTGIDAIVTGPLVSGKAEARAARKALNKRADALSTHIKALHGELAPLIAAAQTRAQRKSRRKSPDRARRVLERKRAKAGGGGKAAAAPARAPRLARQSSAERRKKVLERARTTPPSSGKGGGDGDGTAAATTARTRGMSAWREPAAPPPSNKHRSLPTKGTWTPSQFRQQRRMPGKSKTMSASDYPTAATSGGGGGRHRAHRVAACGVCGGNHPTARCPYGEHYGRAVLE